MPVGNTSLHVTVIVAVWGKREQQKRTKNIWCVRLNIRSGRPRGRWEIKNIVPQCLKSETVAPLPGGLDKGRSRGLFEVAIGLLAAMPGDAK